MRQQTINGVLDGGAELQASFHIAKNDEAPAVREPNDEERSPGYAWEGLQ